MALKKTGNARLIAALLVLTIIVLFFVWTRLQNIRLRRELARLKQEEQRVSVENSRLELEWSRLTLPKRMEETGAEKYGLKRPRPDQVVVLPEP